MWLREHKFWWGRYYVNYLFIGSWWLCKHEDISTFLDSMNFNNIDCQDQILKKLTIICMK